MITDRTCYSLAKAGCNSNIYSIIVVTLESRDRCYISEYISCWPEQLVAAVIRWRYTQRSGWWKVGMFQCKSTHLWADAPFYYKSCM